MEIIVSQEKGRVPVTILHISGAVDSGSAPQLQAHAEQVINGGASCLLLDLKGVPYMSSAGLKALNVIFNRLDPNPSKDQYQEMQKGIRDGTYQSPHLKLLNPTPRVLEVIRIAGLDLYLGVYYNLKDALSAF
jgi:hypothetical protein